MIMPDLSSQYAIQYDNLYDRAITCLVNYPELTQISNALSDFGIKNGGDRTQYALGIVLSNNFRNKSHDHLYHRDIP